MSLGSIIRMMCKVQPTNMAGTGFVSFQISSFDKQQYDDCTTRSLLT